MSTELSEPLNTDRPSKSLNVTAGYPQSPAYPSKIAPMLHCMRERWTEEDYPESRILWQIRF